MIEYRRATYVDDITPRIDGKGKPKDVTVNKQYVILNGAYPDYDKEGMVTIINDKGKRARYLASRFKQEGQ